MADPASADSPSPAVEFDVDGARAAGYSDTAIASYLAKQTNFDLNAAKKAGYNDAAVVNYLAKQPAPPPPAPEESSTLAGMGKGAVSGLVSGVGGVVSGIGGMLQTGGNDLSEEAQQEDQRKALITSTFDALDSGAKLGVVKDAQGNTLNQHIFENYKAASPVQRVKIRANFAAEAPAAGGIEDTLGAGVHRIGEGDRILGGGIKDVADGMLTDEERSRTSVKITSMLGNIIPVIGAAVAGGLPALIGVGGVQGFGEGFDAAKKAGQTDDQAATAGMLNGMVQGGLMAVPVHKALEVMDALPAVARSSVLKALVEVAKSSGTMVGFSELSKLADNAVAKATYDPKRDIMEGVGQDVGVEAAVGAVLPVAGVGLHVAADAAGRALKKPKIVDPIDETPGAQTAADAANSVMGTDNLDDAIATASAASKQPGADLDAVHAVKTNLDAAIPDPEVQRLKTEAGGLNNGIFEKADDETYNFHTKDAEGRAVAIPLKIWDPETSPSTGDMISPDLVKAQHDYYTGEHGINIVYLHDDGHIPFDGAVDPEQPNTLFLSNNPSRNAAQVAAHEFKHTLENTTTPDGESLNDLLLQQIHAGITETGWDYAKLRFSVSAPDRAGFAEGEKGDAEHAQAVTAHLINELSGDLGGEAPKFDTFLPKVMDEVEKRYGQNVAKDMFQKFMDGIRGAMETLRKFFQDGQNTVSQHLVTNLEDIHTTLAKMWAAKYGEAFEAPAARDVPGEVPADRAARLAQMGVREISPEAKFSPKQKDDFDQVEWHPDGPTFYSALTRSVEETKMDKAPPGQWLATIRNMPGVKSEERAWSGVEEWLSSQAKPVTKAEVLEHLRDSDPQLGEVTRAETTPEFIAANRAYREAVKAGAPEEELDRLHAAKSALQTDATKYKKYKLPGGENYRETLMTLPAKDPEGNKITAEEYRRGYRLNAHGEYVGLPELPKQYVSTHWEGVNNVVAHIRHDDRILPNGERALHLAEIQSDWHQAGRRNGYAADDETVRKLAQKAEQARQTMLGHLDRRISEVTDGKYTSKSEALNDANTEAFHKISALQHEPDFVALVTAHNDAVNEFRHARDGVPNAPFKTTWHELAMKRMLRYAAENGYHKLSWDTGETQADRYDIGNTVKRIEWLAFGAKKLVVIYTQDAVYSDPIELGVDEKGVITKPPAQNWDANYHEYEGKKLADVIGKEVSEKILTSGRGELKGQGLKIGGEGMRGFYDKILPNFVNKYVKRWGAKVEHTTLRTGEKMPDGGDRYVVARISGGRYQILDRAAPEGTSEFVAHANRDAGFVMDEAAKLNGGQAPVHSVTITPEMRASVMRGQPKFSPKSKGLETKDKTKELLKAVPGLKRVAANLEPEELAPLMKRTADKLVRLFKSLPSAEETASVAFSGRAKRGWYKHSAQAISELFGTEDGPRFTALLAALSPQTSVESNLENALRTWVNWSDAGRPSDPKEIVKIMGRSVQGSGDASILDAWKNNTIRALTHDDPVNLKLSGPKVNSFAANLRNNVNEVTNDAWMATYAAIDANMLASARRKNEQDGLGDSFGFKSPGYMAMSAVVREAAKILTSRTGQEWTPAEVQETVWSWAKTLYERRDRAGEDRTTKQILQAADLTHEDINSTPDFAKLLVGGIYRNILEGGGYGEGIKKLEQSGAGREEASRITGPAISAASPEGSGIADTAFEKHLQKAAGRLEKVRLQRLQDAGVDPRDLAREAHDSEISANMSAATSTIPGIARLVEEANAGDQSAGRLINMIAHESLEHLVGDIPGVKLEISHNGGLYGGSLEPSIGMRVQFPESVRAQVLSSLSRFARNFNQEQIHVRQTVNEKIGRVATDGSYATPSYAIDIKRPLSRAEIEHVIAEAGIYGLTFNDKRLEAYYVGDPRNPTAIKEFQDGIDRARDALGENDKGARLTVERLWAYGHGDGATQGYPAIEGELSRSKERFTHIPRAIAERLTGREIEPAPEEKTTHQQAEFQRRIASDYEQLPDNDMRNPLVARAYRELVGEVDKQFKALTIKVDVWADRQADGSWKLRDGEPYKSSAEMRQDILDNNHIWVLATTPETFGPPGADFTGHPLLERTGRKSSNGYPMLANDELRAVHDYYAHMMSSARFGPAGEEAAWRNHIATMDNPWARWALTSETRGQNSWVNFGDHVEPNSKLADRPFARQKAALLPLADTLSGNDAVDLPIHELMRELSRDQQRGSLPEEDAFADFSPKMTNEMRAKMAALHPDLAKLFQPESEPGFKTNPAKIAAEHEAEVSSREAEGTARAAPAAKAATAAPKAAAEPSAAPAAKPEPKTRTLTTQHPEGKGKTIERALNDEETRALENEPQEIQARKLVAKDPERALRIAMREEQGPKNLLPTFVYFELERRATAAGDEAMIEKLRESPLAKEVTTAARTVQSFTTRDPQSAVAKIQEVENAREVAATASVAGAHGTLEAAKAAEVTKAAPQIKKAVREQIKARPARDWDAFVDSIVCK